MTFEPTSIAFRLDDVIVQKEPAWPLYCEHSFVAWRAPLRAVGVAELAVVPSAVSAGGRDGHLHERAGACERRQTCRRLHAQRAPRRGHRTPSPRGREPRSTSRGGVRRW